MKNFLQRRINRIYIMLGNCCNMNCAYCLQHPLVQGQLTQKINPDIYDFLKQVVEENGDKIVRLIFYGGEPLLYFPGIKEIVEGLKNRKLLFSYGIISNGRAMTDEMVNFFNENDFSVTISWDGNSSHETRGFDVFAQNEMKSRLLRLNMLGVSGVISSAAYPLEILEAFQKLSDEYQALHRYPLGVNIDEIMDTGLANRWLLNVDYFRIEREIQQMAKLYLDNLIDGQYKAEDYTKIMYIENLLHTARQFYIVHNGRLKKQTAYCGNGLTVLNMDLEGNLYPCHNTSIKAGSIYSDFFDYLQNVLAGENVMQHRKQCLECPALAFCKGGCKLVQDKTEYCKLKRALFVPALELFLQKGYELQVLREA